MEPQYTPDGLTSLPERIDAAWKRIREWAALSGVGVRRSKAACQPALALVGVIVAPVHALHWENGAEVCESAFALEGRELLSRRWKRVLKERWVCAMDSLIELLCKPVNEKYTEFLERKIQDESRRRPNDGRR